MQKIKKFLITDIIIFLIKIIGGLLTNSFTIIASSIYDLLLIFILLTASKKKENSTIKSIFTSLLAFLFILLSIGFSYYVLTNNPKKPSFFLIIFVIIALLTRYAVNCFATNSAYNQKKGLLSLAQISSNIDFYNYGVILGSLILAKLSFLLNILKYSDYLGTVLIVLIIIYKCLKIIVNSFSNLEEKSQISLLEVEKEILKRDEAKKIINLEVNSFGGFRHLYLEFEMKENLSIMDLNTFIVTLQDYLLKYSEIVSITMTNGIIKKKVKVRSKKQDARNSGSRNSKTNSQSKNSKKKNKKR